MKLSVINNNNNVYKYILHQNMLIKKKKFLKGYHTLEQL